MSKATIYINGVIGEDTSLIDVIRQYKSFDNPNSLEVIIDSVGGFVSVGESIYNYLKALPLPVTTIAKNECYSIASYIFLAGDTRLMYDDATLMIHLPWASVDGDADQLTTVAKELKELEKTLSSFYASYTSIDADTITALLKNETYLSAQEAVEMGFSHSIKSNLKAVAMLTNKEEKEKLKMSKTKQFLKALSEFFGDENSEPMNLVIQDANGDEINFTELEEDAEPQPRTDEVAGDKAVDADGKPIEGERVANDGSTWVFETGELVQVVPSETEEETEVEEETETVEASAEEIEEEEFNIEELMKALEDSLFAKLQKDNDDLKSEIKALKKLVGSEDAEVSPQNQSTNTNQITNLPKGIQGLINLRK